MESQTKTFYNFGMLHFIVNIRGGSGKALLKWNKIQKILKEKNIKYKTHITQKAGHASEIARELRKLSLSEENDVRLVVVGGDGALNEVINGIGRNEKGEVMPENFSKIKIGLIPTGSGNDFSRGMKIPRHDPRKALEKILSSDGNKKIDLGIATVLDDDFHDERKRKNLFAISSGFGLNAIVGTGINTAKIKKILNFIHLGKLSYGFYTIQTLFTMKTYSVNLKFDNEEPKTFKKTIFLANMNLKSEGGGIPMNPNAKADDGKISMCMAHGVPKIMTFFFFPFLLFGLQKNLPGFLLKDCKKLEIASDKPSVLHTDGEFRGNVKKVRWESLPGAVSLLV